MPGHRAWLSKDVGVTRGWCTFPVSQVSVVLEGFVGSGFIPMEERL